MKIVLLIAFTFISISLAAQKKIFFSSENYIGLIEGEHGSAFQLETINGIKYKTWFAGAGTGIDWYYRRSIPVFISINQDFFKQRSRNFFVTASGGVNFPWEKNDYNNDWGYTVKKGQPGIFWESGFGYKIGMGKTNDALLLQLSYSYKYMEEKIKNNYTGFIPPPEYPDDHFHYHLKRLSLKAGWNF
jgi:hypothetical protein